MSMSYTFSSNIHQMCFFVCIHIYTYIYICIYIYIHIHAYIYAYGCRERKKLKVHANEGQCDNVTEMFMACSYAIDGDYMFGVTVGPIAHVLEALKVCVFMFVWKGNFFERVCVKEKGGGGGWAGPVDCCGGPG